MVLTYDIVYELTPDDSYPLNATYYKTRTHSFESTKFISADDNNGYITIENVINAFLLGEPSDIVPNPSYTDVSMSMVSVELAVSFQMANLSLLYSQLEKHRSRSILSRYCLLSSTVLLLLP